MNITNKYKIEELEQATKYLTLLSKEFPTISKASTEIINLQAILNLPKGTEHFLSDVHGEYEAFNHMLYNGSGVIRKKIEEVFGCTLRQNEKKSLATLIYYPEQVLKKNIETEEELDDWYEIILHRLILVCREVSSKYTRSKVRKALPKDFAYIIEELLHEEEETINKQDYYSEIIRTIIIIERAGYFIIALCKLIQRLSVDHLHIIGDIYDRGPGADIIMDTLVNYHSVDIQWGNHDIVWMGAAAGSEVCMANTIRISARYGNLDTIEDGYGINLLPLATFAMETYKDDLCENFNSKINNIEKYSNREITLVKQMHKAITIIQFKLEGQLILRNPEFDLENRLLLDKINIDKGVVNIDGKEYILKDTNFPTINWNDPYKLNNEEDEVVKKLKFSYINNEKLQQHVYFLFSKGSMYLKYNSNLLFHGCIPLDENGEFLSMNIQGTPYSGRKLIDKFERLVREAYAQREISGEENLIRDYFLYLWQGPKSSLFGKEKMATFERCFLDDIETHKEDKNPYYVFRDDENMSTKILEEFGFNSRKSHIINGHVPVKVKKGESPIKAGGKLLVIDGGLSKAYQDETGIAGYTLIYNSHGMLFAAHEAFESTQKAIEENLDIVSTLTVLEYNFNRMRMGDTDSGKELKNDIRELEMLLAAYRKGLIKQGK